MQYETPDMEVIEINPADIVSCDSGVVEGGQIEEGD